MVVTSEKDFSEKIKVLEERVASLKPSDNGKVYAELQKDLTELRNANILFWRSEGVSVKTLASSNNLTPARVSQIIAKQSRKVGKC